LVIFFVSLISVNFENSRFFRIFGRSFITEYDAKLGENFQPTKFLTDYFQPMCKILPRIKQLAEHEGITIGALERIIGASKGVLSRAISNGTDIQSKWLQAIVENYPQYSAQWLLTGVGNMMSTSNGIPSHLVETDPTKGKNYIPPTAPIEAPPSQAASDSSLVTNLVTTIQKQAEEIGRLKERIAQLEREKNVGEESFQDAPRELSKSTVDL
jgi:hypothetical protein